MSGEWTWWVEILPVAHAAASRGTSHDITQLAGNDDLRRMEASLCFTNFKRQWQDSQDSKRRQLLSLWSHDDDQLVLRLREKLNKAEASAQDRVAIGMVVKGSAGEAGAHKHANSDTNKTSAHYNGSKCPTCWRSSQSVRCRF